MNVIPNNYISLEIYVLSLNYKSDNSVICRIYLFLHEYLEVYFFYWTYVICFCQMKFGALYEINIFFYIHIFAWVFRNLFPLSNICYLILSNEIWNTLWNKYFSGRVLTPGSLSDVTKYKMKGKGIKSYKENVFS